ncbi:nibrin isoform X3 [Neoarius graeffei]|uniref:nibrin isoform X3 n=2 Tax=Neoarius graeffei TaxID=443677 RepID=UPI00298C48AA|nr:nibrin isoform X3 [Neoarius graeffei]
MLETRSHLASFRASLGWNWILWLCVHHVLIMKGKLHSPRKSRLLGGVWSIPGRRSALTSSCLLLKSPLSFRPEIDEPSLAKEKVDLGPCHERRTLFAGKTFVFLNTKQMKRLSQAISFGGGKSQLLEERSLPGSLLEATGTCVVDMTTGSSQPLVPPTTRKWAESVGLVLQRNGLRFIAESEIGLAAIYVNNQIYCNPCSKVDSESVKLNPAIPEATLSQNAAVDETVLHGTSLNITAYVVNTEPSQSLRRKDVSGTRAVGETPERRPANPRGPISTKPPMATELPAACSEPVSSFGGVREEKVANSEGQKSDECAKFTGPLNNDATIKKSPQKQASLTSYFKPTNKKRLRDGTDSNLSDAKLSRREDEASEETKKSNLAPSLQKSPATRLGSKASQNQHERTSASRYPFSSSLGLGSGLATDSRSADGKQNLSLSFESTSGSKKRKEPEQDPADLDVSLEELESIMSEDMDEPLQPAAKKKQCFDQGERSAAITEEDCKVTFSKQQSLVSTSQNLDQDRQRTASRYSERKSQVTSNKTQNLEREQHSLTNGNDKREILAVKEEEVSFLLETKVQIGSTKHNEEAAGKEELMDSRSGSGTEKDSELPRKLLQIQFKSLTVSASSRTRTEPLQSHNPNGKNFKRFRKIPVLGLQGLPRIIGGSDLVAHNRSKNSELEEWLRDAAEQEKQQELEETLGDDLFRYNPKTSKRR